MDCFENFVTVASFFALIDDVIEKPDGETLNDANNDAPLNHKITRIKFVVLFFLIMDCADVILDLLFSAVLIRMGHGGYAALMITMTAISSAFWIVSRIRLFRYKACQTSMSEEGDDEINFQNKKRKIICFVEIMSFFIEDGTTLFIFYKIPEAFDLGNAIAHVNLATTVIIGCAAIALYICFWCEMRPRCGGLSDLFKYIMFALVLFLLLFNTLVLMGFANTVATGATRPEPSTPSSGASYKMDSDSSLYFILILLTVLCSIGSLAA